MPQTLFEKLQLKDEKNLLIQGIPSAIEKQFVKLAFSKNVTPLLKSKKIDFALVFAVNLNQLSSILREVLPALHEEAKLWVAYPKAASKIASDLNRDCSWNCLCDKGFENVRAVAIDHVWTALRFKKAEQIPILTRASAVHGVAAAIEEGRPSLDQSLDRGIDLGVDVAVDMSVDLGKRTVALRSSASRPPEDLEQLFTLHPKAKDFFDALSFSNKKEYVTWITGAKKEDTRKRRLDSTLEKLKAGKKNPSEK
jgi:hypothetical protein